MDVASLTYYSISPRMLGLLASIHHRLGEVHARHLHSPPSGTEQAYHISVVQSTLAIEGGGLEALPVAELVRRPAAATEGPEALEVVNTHRVHTLLSGFDPFAEQDLRQAHAMLMHGLALDAGQYRTGPMDVLYGEPQPLRTSTAHDLPIHVQELLRHVEEDDFPILLSSCVLHFGLVYLRPFTAGNGRLARLWQKRMLQHHWPVFGHLPVEAFIHRAQPAYYAALEYADRRGDCGEFISYLLERVDEALAELLDAPDRARSSSERVELFLSKGPLRGSVDRTFRRKDYLNYYPALSTATASRDLMDAVDKRIVQRQGTRRTATYRVVPSAQ